jgi:ribonuclease HII
MLLAYHTKDIPEAGCDEAGRGCLAGPVFAAAVILPPAFSCDRLNDSKKLNEKTRFELRPIIEAEALAWGIGIVEAHEIDAINILNASILAMHRAIHSLKVKPAHLLIDGNRFRTIKQLPLYKLSTAAKEVWPIVNYDEIPFTCIVKGDGKYQSIAAASILAKTYRDDWMNRLHEDFPLYNWQQNKGYPTEEHRKALREYGVTKHHRRSFHVKEEQLSFDF